jgi:hypothetical protein
VSDRFVRVPLADDCEEFVSIEPSLSDEFGSGGTSKDGTKSPFFVAEVPELRSPFAFGAEATRRKNLAADPPIEFFGLGGIGPPAIPLPSCEGLLGCGCCCCCCLNDC